MGEDPQPGPFRPRHSGELSDPQEQTNPPSHSLPQLGAGLALRMHFSECFDLFAHKDTDEEKEGACVISHGKYSESEIELDPHSWQQTDCRNG